MVVVFEFGKFLGWVAVWGYGIALLNFVMKYVNKQYVNKLPKDKKAYIDIYRTIMKYVIRYHKAAGIIASVAIMFHFYFMFTSMGLSVPGLIAAITMWTVFTLGIYGYAVLKNPRGSWVKIHRVLSFMLIVLIVFHVMFTRVFLIYR